MKKIFTYLLVFISALLFFLIQNSFAQTSRTNIVLIIGDDLRYNSFKQTGGPDWFSTPGIDQLADEGATFDNYYCVYSLCITAPTGLTKNIQPLHAFLIQ
jgi:hypothetical protein